LLIAPEFRDGRSFDGDDLPLLEPTDRPNCFATADLVNRLTAVVWVGCDAISDCQGEDV
jgi:hypothetical protein